MSIPEYQETIFLEHFASIITNSTRSKSVCQLFSDEHLNQYLDLYQTRFNQLEDDLAEKRYIGGCKESHQFLLDSLYHQISILRLVYIIISVNEVIATLDTTIPTHVMWTSSIAEVQDIVVKTQGILILILHIIKWVETHRKPPGVLDQDVDQNPELSSLNSLFKSPFSHIDELSFHDNPSYSMLSALIAHFTMSEHIDDLRNIITSNSLLWYSLTTVDNMMLTDDTIVSKYDKWNQFCEIGSFYKSKLIDLLQPPDVTTTTNNSSKKVNPSVAILYSLLADIHEPLMKPNEIAAAQQGNEPFNLSSNPSTPSLLVLCTQLAAAKHIEYDMSYFDAIWIALHQAVFRVLHLYITASATLDRSKSTCIASSPPGDLQTRSNSFTFDPVDFIMASAEDRKLYAPYMHAKHDANSNPCDLSMGSSSDPVVELLTTSLLADLHAPSDLHSRDCRSTQSTGPRVDTPEDSADDAPGQAETSFLIDAFPELLGPDTPSHMSNSTHPYQSWSVHSLSRSMTQLLSIDRLLREHSDASLSPVYARYTLLSSHVYSPIMYALMNQDFLLLSETLEATMNNFEIWTPVAGSIARPSGAAVDTSTNRVDPTTSSQSSRAFLSTPRRGNNPRQTPLLRQPPSTTITSQSTRDSHDINATGPHINEYELQVYLRFYFAAFSLTIGVVCSAYDYATHTYEPDFDYDKFAADNGFVLPESTQKTAQKHGKNTPNPEDDADPLTSPAVFYHYISSTSTMHQQHVLTFLASLWWCFPLLFSPLQLQHQQQHFPSITNLFYHHHHYKRFLSEFNNVMLHHRLRPLHPLPVLHHGRNSSTSPHGNYSHSVPIALPYQQYMTATRAHDDKMPSPTADLVPSSSSSAAANHLSTSFDHYRIACTFPSFLSNLLPPSLFIPFYIAFVSSQPTPRYQSALLQETEKHAAFAGKLPYIARLVASNNISFSLEQITHPQLTAFAHKIVTSTANPLRANDSNQRRLSSRGGGHGPSTPLLGVVASSTKPVPSRTAFSLFKTGKPSAPSTTTLNSSVADISMIKKRKHATGEADTTPLRAKNRDHATATPRGKFSVPIFSDDDEEEDEDGNQLSHEQQGISLLDNRKRLDSSRMVGTPRSRAKFSVAIMDDDDDEFDHDGGDSDSPQMGDFPAAANEPPRTPSPATTPSTPQPLSEHSQIEYSLDSTTTDGETAQQDQNPPSKASYEGILRAYFLPPQPRADRASPPSIKDVTSQYSTVKAYVLQSLSKLYPRIVSSKPRASVSSSRLSLRGGRRTTQGVDNISPIAIISHLVEKNDPTSSLSRLYGWVSGLTTIELAPGGGETRETRLAHQPSKDNNNMNRTALHNNSMLFPKPSAVLDISRENERSDQMILRKLFNAGSIAVCSTNLQMINELLEGLIPVEISLVSSSIITAWLSCQSHDDLTLPVNAYPDASLLSILSLYNATMRAYISTGNLPYALYVTVQLRDLVIQICDKLEMYFTYLLKTGTQHVSGSASAVSFSRSILTEIETKGNIYKESQVWLSYFDYLTEAYSFISSLTIASNTRRLYLREQLQVDGVWDETIRLYAADCLKLTNKVQDYIHALELFDLHTVNADNSSDVQRMLSYSKNQPTVADGRIQGEKSFNSNVTTPEAKSSNADVDELANLFQLLSDPDLILSDDDDADDDSDSDNSDSRNDDGNTPHNRRISKPRVNIGYVITSLFDDVVIQSKSKKINDNHVDAGEQLPVGTNIRLVETRKIQPYIISQILYLTLAVVDGYIDITGYLLHSDAKKAQTEITPSIIHQNVTKLVKIILQIVFNLIRKNQRHSVTSLDFEGVAEDGQHEHGHGHEGIFPPQYLLDILETLRVTLFRYYAIKKR